MKSVGGKFVADIFSATLFGTEIGSIESYGVAFVTGGLSKDFFRGKGLAGFGMDVAVRPILTQFAEIGTGKIVDFVLKNLHMTLLLEVLLMEQENGNHFIAFTIGKSYLFSVAKSPTETTLP
jgi:hypothetical protein